MGSSGYEQQQGAKYDRWLAEQKRTAERQASGLAYLQQRTHEHDTDGRYLMRLSLKVRYDDVGDILAVLVSSGEKGQQVAFHSGDELIDTLAAAANRWANGQLRWKDDEDG